MACDVWLVACGVWRVACGLWHVACGARGVWGVSCVCVRVTDRSIMHRCHGHILHMTIAG